MKGNEKIIEHMNLRLAEHLTAINNYMVHANMCGSWRYEKLRNQIEKRANDEIKSAGKLIAQMLFLEGRLIVCSMKRIYIGDEVPPKAHQNGRSIKEVAILSYNESIRLALECSENGNRELLEAILNEEKEYMD